MYTKNAFKNLRNRYKAVLKKCTLLNTFGSLALASAFLMSSVGMSVVPHSACASTVQETDAYLIEETITGTNYYKSFEVQEADANGTITTTQYGILLKTPTATAGMTGTASTMKDLLTAYIETEKSSGSTNAYDSIKVEDNSGTFYFNYTTDNNATTQPLYFRVLDTNNTEITNMNTTDRETDPSTALNSNFIGISNDTTSTSHGGAINNTSNNASIDITGDFIGNSTSFISSDGFPQTLGGAIYNTGTIGDITGSFIGNYASSIADLGVYGGAISNIGSSAKIDSISGNFIGNYASNTTAMHAQGGAIYNNGVNAKITSITGSFIGNYASVLGQGGAIYNTGTIGAIRGSFIGNYANGSKDSGGAIYSSGGTLNFLADSETHLFTDNYTTTTSDGITTKDYNFIYYINTTSINFTMQDTGGFILNDSIKGDNGHINITGEDKDKNIFSLNDEINGFSNFNVKNATLSLGSYDHGDSSGNSTTVASFAGYPTGTSSSMSFTNANLSINTLAFDGITEGKAALVGTNIRLTADADSTLILANASANTYTIAQNFADATDPDDAADSTQEAPGATEWFTNTIVSNALLEVTSTSGDAMGDAYTVTVGVKPLPETDTETESESESESDTNNSIYNTPSAGLLHAIADSKLYVANSTNAGARFVYNTMENSATNTAQKIQIVEGAVQMGAVAGVQKQFASTITSANTVLDTRMLNENSINPSSTAMRVVDENGHVSVYDNISTVASNGNANNTGGGMLSSPQNYTEIWLMPMYAHEKISGVSSGNFSNTGYKSDMYGVALGIDRTFQDKYRIGLAFDMGSGNSESNADYASTENDYDFFGFTAYGSVRFDNLSILGSIGYTKNDSEVTQNLSAYGLNNLYSDIKSDVWNFNLKAEYNYAFGEGYTLTPYVGVQYMIMSTDDYKVQESNSVGNGVYGNTVFNINSDRQEVFSFPMGIALSKEIHTENGWDFTPKVNAGVIFATGDLHATSVSSVPGIDGTSSMSLKVIDSTTLDLGLGLSASKNNFTMMLDYDFQHSEHRTAHG